MSENDQKEASLKLNLCLLGIDLEAAGDRGRPVAVRGPAGLSDELGHVAIARCGLATVGPGDTVH